MNALQLAIVALLVLLAMMPFIAIVWKGTDLHRHIWNCGCQRWVMCCDRLLGERVEQGDAPSRSAQYQRMFEERRIPSLALRLAAWREDVLGRSRSDPLTVKLQQLPTALCGEAIERSDASSVETQPRSNQILPGTPTRGAPAEEDTVIHVHEDQDASV